MWTKGWKVKQWKLEYLRFCEVFRGPVISNISWYPYLGKRHIAESYTPITKKDPQHLLSFLTFQRCHIPILDALIWSIIELFGRLKFWGGPRVRNDCIAGLDCNTSHFALWTLWSQRYDWTKSICGT